MPLEIKAELEKYVQLTENGERIDKFVCPVEGCDFTSKLGPGALRMHVLLKSDAGIKGRYNEAHEAFYKAHEEELDLDTVRYLRELLEK